MLTLHRILSAKMNLVSMLTGISHAKLQVSADIPPMIPDQSTDLDRFSTNG